MLHIWRSQPVSPPPLVTTEHKRSWLSVATISDNRYPKWRRWSHVRKIALIHRVQIGSGAHTASYPMGTSGSFRGDKAAGAW